MKNKFVKSMLVALVGVFTFGLASCNAKVEQEGHYIMADIESSTINASQSDFATTYDLKTFSDGSYVLEKQSIMEMFGSTVGNEHWTLYGTFTKGIAVDGYLPITLSAATRLVYTAEAHVYLTYAEAHDSELETYEESFEIIGGTMRTFNVGGTEVSAIISSKAQFLSLAPEVTYHIVLDSTTSAETVRLSKTAA